MAAPISASSGVSASAAATEGKKPGKDTVHFTIVSASGRVCCDSAGTFSVGTTGDDVDGNVCDEVDVDVPVAAKDGVWDGVCEGLGADIDVSDGDGVKDDDGD
jgi:hypothetical protein